MIESVCQPLEPRPPIVGKRRPRGKILAVRWGLNPNSSSLGVDITFLLFGLSIITLLTPVLIGAHELGLIEVLASPPHAHSPTGYMVYGLLP